MLKFAVASSTNIKVQYCYLTNLYRKDW